MAELDYAKEQAAQEGRAGGHGEITVTPQFILAGEAIFTISNGKGDHRTYKVDKSEPSPQFPNPAHFIKMLTGSDNTDDGSYRYLGMVLTLNVPEARIKMTQRSAWRDGDEPVRIARFALRAIWQAAFNGYKLPAGYSIKHVGRCGRCGRALTTPASLDTGLGETCANELGVEWAERGARLFDSGDEGKVEHGDSGTEQ